VLGRAEMLILNQRRRDHHQRVAVMTTIIPSMNVVDLHRSVDLLRVLFSVGK